MQIEASGKKRKEGMLKGGKAKRREMKTRKYEKKSERLKERGEKQ